MVRLHVALEQRAAFAAATLGAGAGMELRRDDLLKITPLGWACRCGLGGVGPSLPRSGRRSGCRALGDPARLGAEEGT
jgi:hypothetical protein